MRIRLQCHSHELIVLEHMVVHVVFVVGLQSLRCPLIVVLGKQVLGPRIPTKKLLQVGTKVECGAQLRVLCPQCNLKSESTMSDTCQNNKQQAQPESQCAHLGGGALVLFPDILGPSHIGSQSKIEIRMLGWILDFEMGHVIQPPNQSMLPQACHGVLALAVKGWK